MAVLKPDSFRTMTIDDIDGHARSFSSSRTSSRSTSWATTSITCSRRSSSSRNAVRNCLRGRVEQREGRIVLGGLAEPRARAGQGPAVHPHRPGHRVARGAGRRLPDGRPRQGRHRVRRTPASSAIAIRSSKRTRSSSRSASPARPPTRSRPCARPRRRARWRWAWSTSSAARSPARPTRGIYLHAGPEIGVASTKAFTCQCVVLTMLALYVGRRQVHEPGAVARR